MHIVTFAFSPMTPRSQGPGVTQAAWTTPQPLIYEVFQGKAPPRGLSAQARRVSQFHSISLLNFDCGVSHFSFFQTEQKELKG